MTDRTIQKATANDVGCHVSGWHGQYGGAAMVLTARSFGYNDAELIAIAEQHYDSMASRDHEPITDDEHQQLSDALDEVEQWLNDNVAQDGYAFGWHDGEFFYQSATWWEVEAW